MKKETNLENSQPKELLSELPFVDDKDKSLTTAFMENIIAEKNSNYNTNNEKINDLDNNKLTSSGFKNLNKNTVLKYFSPYEKIGYKSNIYNQFKSKKEDNQFKSKKEDKENIPISKIFNPTKLNLIPGGVSYEETKGVTMVHICFDAEWYKKQQEEYKGKEIFSCKNENISIQFKTMDEIPMIFRTKYNKFNDKKYEEYHNKEYPLVQSEFYPIDYLNWLENQYGSGVFYDLKYDETNQCEEVFYMDMIGFFSRVDVRYLGNELCYRRLIKKALIEKKITDKKNFKVEQTRDNETGKIKGDLIENTFLRTDYIVTRVEGKNIKQFRLYVCFTDIGKICGNVSLSNTANIVGHKLTYKDNFTKLEKGDFYNSLTFEKRDIFKDYALGDTEVREVLNAYINTFNNIRRELNLPYEEKEYALTIGSNVAELSKDLKFIDLGGVYGYKPESKDNDGKKSWWFKIKENGKIKWKNGLCEHLKYILDKVSIKTNRKYLSDTRGLDGVTGGHCLRTFLKTGLEGSLADIDMKGAYANSQAAIFDYVGLYNERYLTLKDAEGIEEFEILTKEQKELMKKFNDNQTPVDTFESYYKDNNICIKIKRELKDNKPIMDSLSEKTKLEIKKLITKNFTYKKTKISKRLRRNKTITCKELFENLICLEGFNTPEDMKTSDYKTVDMSGFLSIVNTRSQISFDLKYFISKHPAGDPYNDLKLVRIIQEENQEETLINDYADNANQGVYLRSLVNVKLSGYDWVELKKTLSPNQLAELLEKTYVKLVKYYDKAEEITDPIEFMTRIYELSKLRKKRFEEKLEDPNTPKFHYKFRLSNIVNKFTIGRKKAEIKRKELDKLDKKSPEEEFYKLICNTIYGTMVSKYFIIGNSIVANNITSLVRITINKMLDGLNLKQAITDGGVIDLNNVNYYKYYKSKRSFICKQTPLKNYEKEKDVIKYEIKVIDIEKPNTEDSNFKEYKSLELNILYKDKTKETLNDKEARNYIARNSLLHLKSLYPDSIVFNMDVDKELVEGTLPKNKYYVLEDNFKVEFNEKEKAEKYVKSARKDGKPEDHIKENEIEYKIQNIKSKGIVEFEIKTMLTEMILDNRADYILRCEAFKEDIIKIRGVKISNNVRKLELDENKEIFSFDYNGQHPAIEKLHKINENPNKVEILEPYQDEKIVSVGSSIQSKYIRNNPDTKVGDTHMQFKRLRYGGLTPFFFDSPEQKVMFKIVDEKLFKKKGMGLGIFFSKQDKKGKLYINLERYNLEMQKIILNELKNPESENDIIKYFDKHYNNKICFSKNVDVHKKLYEMKKSYFSKG